jgi:N-carbamoylputrescine amidase
MRVPVLMMLVAQSTTRCQPTAYTAAMSLIHVAVLQMKPAKGKRSANLGRLQQALGHLREAGTGLDVLVLPESAFTGYFLQGGVRELAVSAAELAAELHAIWQSDWNGRPLDVVVGFFERFQNDYYNSSLYVELSNSGFEIKHVHRKVFLPTYGVFDEARYQSAGASFQAFDTRFGRVAMMICEDAWHSVSGMICALDGAEVVYIPSASPVRGLDGAEPSNVVYWRNLVKAIASEHGMFAVLASLTGFEGGKALMGSSLVAHPDGRILAQADVFDEELLLVTLNLAAIQPARFDNPLLADLRTVLPGLLPSLQGALSATTKPSIKPEAQP